jgi:hypothetical protein
MLIFGTQKFPSEVHIDYGLRDRNPNNPTIKAGDIVKNNDGSFLVQALNPNNVFLLPISANVHNMISREDLEKYKLTAQLDIRA